MACPRLTLPSMIVLELLFAAAAFGRAAEEKSKAISGGAEFDFNSRYIWCSRRRRNR